MTTLEQFALALSRIDDPEELIRYAVGVLQDRFHARLINFGIYGALDRFQRFTDRPTGVVSVMPDPWAERYLEQNHFVRDDAFAHLQTGNEARTWSSFGPNIVMAEAAEFGLTHGVAVPLFGAGAVKAGIMLGGDKTLEDPDALPLVEAMAVLLHARFDMIGRSMQRPELTATQDRILQWLAADKSKPVIAEIEGLAVHTVDYHLRQIYQKFGTASRLETVMRAMILGMLRDPHETALSTRLRSTASKA